MVRDTKPRHVIEIGTWSGKRAMEFMAVSDCYYTGFDLFEEATKDTDKKEFNVKPHHSLVDASDRIFIYVVHVSFYLYFCHVSQGAKEKNPLSVRALFSREHIHPSDFLLFRWSLGIVYILYKLFKGF